jgi:hypothetical protein
VLTPESWKAVARKYDWQFCASTTYIILSQMAGGNALPAIIFMLDEKSCLHMINGFL